MMLLYMSKSKKLKKQKTTKSSVNASQVPNSTDQASRSPLDFVVVALQGGAMGIANTIPGVSGGTMAFIFGIYEELLDSIKAIGHKEVWQAVFKGKIGKAFQQVNGLFLLSLVVGIGVAILVVARVLERTLDSNPVIVWSFFFGLILASVWSVGRRITNWNTQTILAFVIGTVSAFLLVGLSPSQTPESAWFLLLAGAIAVCALILPGLSGSLILVLMGKYKFILNAVNEGDLVSLGLLVLGGLIGLVLFAQVVSWLFKKYPNVTIAVLTGFVLGSLRKVWPWQLVDGKFSVNINPPIGQAGGWEEFVLAMIAALIGMVLVFWMDVVSKEKA